MRVKFGDTVFTFEPGIEISNSLQYQPVMKILISFSITDSATGHINNHDRTIRIFYFKIHIQGAALFLQLLM